MPGFVFAPRCEVFWGSFPVWRSSAHIEGSACVVPHTLRCVHAPPFRAGGGLSTSTVLIVGVSCIVAEALSMGLGEFLSSKAMNEYMALQRKRGEWQLGHNREVGVW